MENQELPLQAAPDQQLQLVQQTNELETFGTSEQFNHAQRLAKAMSSASIIPDIYRGNIPNCLIAMEMANRIGISPIMVMQNLYIVKGKPSWAGSFVIGLLNSCGRFSPLRFEMSGAGDKLQCRAWACDKATGERLNGTLITMAMVTSESWGSKWKTMPEQMMCYRSAAFFARVYAPDICMGMQTTEEAEDVRGEVITYQDVEKIYHEKCEAEKLTEEEKKSALRILTNKEENSYSKLQKLLQSK